MLNLFLFYGFIMGTIMFIWSWRELAGMNTVSSQLKFIVLGILSYLTGWLIVPGLFIAVQLKDQK